MARTRIRWTALRDGIAHAHRPGLPRTLCGQVAIVERDAWPTFRRCLACRALAEEHEHASEGELQLLWGK